MNDLKERYLSIQKIIRTHDYEYYILDDSKISDQEYDELFRELRQIESENPDWITPESPSQRVGIKPESDIATFKHFQQMLSLANAFNEEDLRNFIEENRHQVQRMKKSKNFTDIERLGADKMLKEATRQ